MTLFEAVRQHVTAREAAELYGIRAVRGKMAICPFHDDRHPSLMLDKRFYCFGCGAKGDAIDLTAGLFDLRPLEAAKKLAADFRIPYDGFRPDLRPVVRRETAGETADEAFRLLMRYMRRLEKWQRLYRPRPEDAAMSPDRRYAEAVRNLPGVRDLTDRILSCRREDREALVKNFGLDAVVMKLRAGEEELMRSDTLNPDGTEKEVI